MSLRIIAVASVVAGLVALCAGPVHASADTQLHVHVVGPAAPVAGTVLVVAREDDPSDRRTRVVTADDVVYAFVALQPGEYVLSVTLPGGRRAELAVTAGAGRTAVCSVSFPADSTALPSVATVDHRPAGEGARFDARALRDLPTAGDVWSLAETAAPFVVADRLDTGGLGTGRSALVGSRGASWALTTVLVDGLPITAPTGTGLLAALPDMNAAQAVSILSGVSPVEVETPGVVVDWQPRRPGTTWHGGVDGSVTTPGWVGTNGLAFAPSIARIEDWRQAAAFAGGPLSDRTGLFASTTFSRATYLERERAPLLTAAMGSLFAHVVARPSVRDQFRALVSVEAATYPFADRRQFAGPEVDERATFGRGQVAWDRVGDTGRRVAVAMGVQRSRWQPEAGVNAEGGTIDRVWDGVVPAPATDEIRVQWDGRVEYATGLQRVAGATAGSRLGITVRRTSAARDVLVAPAVAESVAGLPARVWLPDPAGPSSERTVTAVGLYAEEQLAVGPRVTVDVGARVDLVRGSNRGATGINWNTFSPRLSFRWSPAAISFFGAVGRYTGGQALSFLAFGDPGETTWDVHRWADGNGDGQYGDGERGVLVARAGAGAGVAGIDPDLRVPRTTEWVVGAELRPTRHSTLRGSIVIGRQTNLVGVVNTGLSASDYRAFSVPDINADEGSPADDQRLPIFERLPESFGRDALLLTNPATEAIQHEGIELTYAISSPRWFMLFGATAYRTLGLGGTLGHGVRENDPLVLGDRYWNPNALKDEAGRLFFDRAYVGKWTTAYRAPGDVRLAAVVRYQDGQPFTRLVVAPDLAGGPEITHAYAMGRTRFTYTATLDVRVEKGIGVGGARRASVRLDVFNLTNHQNELEEDVLTGPLFRLSTIVQPPRTLRLGVRVEF